MVPRAAGGVTVVGSVSTALDPAVLQFDVDSKGNVTRKFETEARASVYGVIKASNGDLIMALNPSTESGDSLIGWRRVNAAGGVVGSGQYSSSNWGYGLIGGSQFIAPADGGGAVIVGTASAKTEHRGAIVRVDGFGHDSCEAAGLCFQQSEKACDDNKPCTVDDCDGKTGKCTHKPAAEGAGCGTNGVCIKGGCVDRKPEMAYVPQGPFWQGCNPWLYPIPKLAPKCPLSQTPQRIADVPGFWIQRTEVTGAQYQQCVKACKCTATSGEFGCVQGGGRAANCVLAPHGEDYCKWLGGRLPTAAEWEKAARGGCETLPAGSDCQKKMRTFPWGESSVLSKSCNMLVWFCNTNVGSHHPGGSPPDRSPYGLVDMAGNLSEWLAENTPIGPASNDPKPIQDYVKPFDPAVHTCSTSKCLPHLRGGNYLVNDVMQVVPSFRKALAYSTDVTGFSAKIAGFRCVIPHK